MQYDDDLVESIFERNPPLMRERLRGCTVGIAGAGGLGSNIAISLARSGLGRLIIADFDIIQASNLNRQQYRLDQIGKVKVDALKENILSFNPSISVETYPTILDEENIPRIFKEADIISEAFDSAQMKMMIIETVLSRMPDKYLIVGNGLAGYGNTEALRIKRLDRLIICGDCMNQVSAELGLCASRVAIVANMEANVIIEILMSKEFEDGRGQFDNT